MSQAEAKEEKIDTKGKSLQLSAKEVVKKYKLTLVATFFSVLTFGIAINLVPIMFVPLSEEVFYGVLNLGHLSLLIGISFVAQMIILTSCSKLPDKFGLRPILIITASLTVVGFLLMFFAPVFFGERLILVGLIIAVIVYGVSAGFMATLLNPVINNLPFRNKEKTLTLFHTAFAVGLIISILGITLGIFFLPYVNWNFIPLMASIIPLTAGILWLKAPIIQKQKGEEVNKDISVEQLSLDNFNITEKSNSNRKSLMFVLLACMMLAMATEAIVSKGASTYVDMGLGVPKLLGDILGPVMFAVMLGAGRLIYGLWGENRNMHKFMIFGSLLCFILYLVAVFTPNAWIGVVALALCGLGSSIIIPSMLAKTGKRFKDKGVKVFVWMSAAGKIGAAGGPALFGLLGYILGSLLSDMASSLGMTYAELGLRVGLLICSIFPLVSFIMQIVFKQKIKIRIEEKI
ncbi:MAG: MFS transporter [Firmicutes bacterium]|nr:MFS transporter [Bacillota bacterium]